MSINSDKISIEIIRHSTSHVLATVIQQLHSEAKFGIGPVIENGFYYDLDLKRSLTLEDLPKIEKKMRELIKQGLSFEKKELTIKEALDLFKKLKQPYKIELIRDLQKNENAKKVTIYQTGDFTDLCRGPHVQSTKEIDSEAFKLTKIAGAYWKGDEKNKMLQRIYGVAFKSKKELNEYLKQQTEAEKRDHRNLNRMMNLYMISEEVGPGLVILKPKGATIREEIEKFWKKEHQKKGYQYVSSPHIGKLDLWKKSGHWQFYRENLYSPMEIEENQYLLKPMNCPFHVQIYQSQIRSYKELPIRYCELGTVYRYEKAGVLHGLLRVRGFTQDDAHIFCRPDQVGQEVLGVLNLALFMLKTFGFKKYEFELAVRDPKGKKKDYLGSDKIWEKAEQALVYALEKKKLKYHRAEGEAVFYGPKIDIKLIDALGRGWQGPTIQVDFNFPEKFNLSYIDSQSKKQQPIMIHRTVLGATDTRFLGCLLEHHGGALPVWLSPVQAQIIPVSQKFNRYAQQIEKQLKDEDIRVELSDHNETLSKKIREGELQKIPYLLVVGGKEQKAKSVAVRDRKKGDLGPMKINKFVEKIKEEIEKKK
jgi:threonyl-tRNA synthetase